MPNRTKVAARGACNRVRIIGGEFRSRILQFPPTLQLRPTPDRVRETLFNWLGQDLTGQACLDLFAGSGALGFEAASRGASKVVMVERDRHAVTALQENQRLLSASTVQIVQRDALEFLRNGKQPLVRSFDIIFLDPPYDFGNTEALLSQLTAYLAADGVVYREGPEFLSDIHGWVTHRSAKAGAVHYQLLNAAHG